MTEPGRVGRFIKDGRVEDVLEMMNDRLAGLQEELAREAACSEQPMVFVVGAPKSGTTLMAQVLAASGLFSYPDNIVARFWRAPYVGMILSRSLAPRTEPGSDTFYSDHGRTFQPWEPHEFGYFWQRWFPPGETHEVPAEDLTRIDQNGLLESLASMQAASGKPLMFKNLVCGLQLGFLRKVLPNAFFVVIRRHPLQTGLSILRAREDVHNDRDAWFSLRPRQYTTLKHLSPPEQAAGQIYYTYRRIAEGLDGAADDRRLHVEYEDLCRTPVEIVKRIADALGGDGFDGSRLPAGFEVKTRPAGRDSDIEALARAWERLSGEKIGLRE